MSDYDYDTPQPISPPQTARHLATWHKKWSFELERWLHQHQEDPFHDILHHFSNLVTLIEVLLRQHGSLSPALSEQLSATARYLISHDDYVSEENYNVTGLLDDLLAVEEVLRAALAWNAQWLNSLWVGPPMLGEVLDMIQAQRPAILNTLESILEIEDEDPNL